MQLPTDPERIAELERLMADAEEARQKWLDATERIYEWLRTLDGRVTVPTAPPRPANRKFGNS